METKSVPSQTFRRLPQYLAYLKSLPQDGPANISATVIAQALDMNDVQVRKDLAMISDGGRPKIGYVRTDLIRDIERFLGYDDTRSAVLVGAGNLGRALLSYERFEEYGLSIAAAFDTDPALIGTTVHKTPILPVNKLADLCRRLKIHIGILTVPDVAAQAACDALVEGGILAIWNFSPTQLRVPGGILVFNENMAGSLAVLSKHLSIRFCRAERRDV